MVIKIGSIYKIDGSYKNNGRKESWDTDEHINDLTEMTHKQFRIIKKDRRESRNQKYSHAFIINWFSIKKMQ